jgi:metal-dependent amidase/aminoacylase/carboxypeptidase family protein
VPVVDPGQATGSEDVGLLARAAEAPCCYWLLGGADRSHFAHASKLEDYERIARDLPSNHSPLFAPVIEPTLGTGVAAFVAAARTWLPPSG